MIASNIDTKLILYSLVSSFRLKKTFLFSLSLLNFIVYIKLIDFIKDILLLLFLYLSFIFCTCPLYKESSLKKGFLKCFQFFLFSFNLNEFFFFYQKFLNLYLRLNEDQNLSNIYSSVKKLVKGNGFFFVSFFLGSLPLALLLDKILEKSINYIYILQSVKIFCKLFYLYHDGIFILYLTRLLKLPLNIIKNV
jgi:hypothetical protein